MLGDKARIDAAFLDPPYNVRINGHANARGRHREFAMASGEMTDAAFRSFLAESLGACAAVSRDGAVHFVCMDWRHMADLELVLPLHRHGRRRRHHDEVDAPSQQHLAHDEAGLNRFPETDVVGDQQVDAGQPKRLAEG